MVQKIIDFFKNHYHLRYEGVYQHARKIFVFDMFLIACTIFLFGVTTYFFLWKPGIADNLTLSISLGNERLASGNETAFTVTYHNTTHYTLTNSVLHFHLPPGFIADQTNTSSRAILENNQFLIGKLLPGAQGKLVVPGILWTDLSRPIPPISATLSYTIAESGFSEQKISSFFPFVTDSALTTTFEITSTTFPNSPTPFRLTLTNKSNVSLLPLQFKATPPELEKQLTNAKITLAAHEQKTVTGTTIFSPQNSSSTVAITPLVFINQNALTQTHQEQPIHLVTPSFAISAAFASSTRFAEVGGTIPLTIVWKNDGEIIPEKATIEISDSNHMIDLAETAKENNLKVENNKIVITARERTLLLHPTSGTSDEFTVILKLQDHFVADLPTQTKLTVTPTLVATFPQISGVEYRAPATAAVIPLATDLQLILAPRYYTDEGDQIGRGPLPPQVGKITKYWLIATISNSTNEISGARFLLHLAPDVEPTGKQSVTLGNKVTYSTSDRTLAWEAEKIPAQNQARLYVEVSITPTASQIGKTVPLILGTNFSGTDTWAGKNFALSQGTVFNVLPNEDLGAKKGANVK